MNRKQMIDFVNYNVLPDAEIPDFEWLARGKSGKSSGKSGLTGKSGKSEKCGKTAENLASGKIDGIAWKI